MAETRMSPVEVSKVMFRLANMVFGQNWILSNEKDNVDDEDLESDEESNDQREPTSMMPEVFPSRRTIMRYLQDASYLSLEYVAQQILSKEYLIRK